MRRAARRDFHVEWRCVVRDLRYGHRVDLVILLSPLEDGTSRGMGGDTYWVLRKVKAVQKSRNRNPHVHLPDFPAHAHSPARPKRPVALERIVQVRVQEAVRPEPLRLRVLLVA